MENIPSSCDLFLWKCYKCMYELHKLYDKTLPNDQLDATNFFDTFITILYMYVFRAISCSSSGGQIVLIQHLVSSLWKQVSYLKLL